MPGRHAKPVELHILEGNPNRLTKAEIKDRQESEVQLGTQDFKMPKIIRKNKIAKKKWKEIIELFVEVQFVSTSDTTLLERYCLTYAEYVKLQDVRAEIEKVAEQKGVDVVSTFNKMGEFGLENAINKKMDMLIKMEDRLFLNPLAKLKNIRKKKTIKKEANDPYEQQFGEI